MAENLDAMKGRLEAVFNEVVDNAEANLKLDTFANQNLAAELLKAAAMMAQTVASIEQKEQASELADLRKLVMGLTEVVLEPAKTASKRAPAAKPARH